MADKKKAGKKSTAKKAEPIAEETVEKKPTKKVEPKKADSKKTDKAKEKAKKAKAKEREKKTNWILGIRGELKRTTWPSWSTVKNNTITVIAVLLTIGAFICVLDLGFGYARNKFLETKTVQENSYNYEDFDTNEQSAEEQPHDPNDGQDHTGHDHE